MLKRILQKSQLLPLSKNSSFNYYFASNIIPKYSFLDIQKPNRKQQRFLEDIKSSKIPVTVLTGFLGSGKTTLLNYILSENHGKKIAVIENEFGEVGVDDQLVTKKIQGTGQIIEMMNGCICCTVRGDLVKTLKDLIHKLEKFDYILIETTGLADPAPVAQTFFIDPVITDLYRLDAIITVVDAKHIERHLADTKSQGVENESVEQIAFADKILLNKIDLVTPVDLERIKGKIREINGVVEIFETRNSVIDLDKILDIQGFNIEAILKAEPDFLNNDHHKHDSTISSVGLKFPGDLNNILFNNFVNQYVMTNSEDIFRYKGVIAIHGIPKKVIFQGIHMIFKMEESAEDWGVGVRENRICFIGRNLNKEFITDAIAKCIYKGDLPLRFKLGEKVECQTDDGWCKGTVIRLWDEGNPYRVTLDDGVDVHAPLDEDQTIRLQSIKLLRFKLGDKVECQTDQGWSKGTVIRLWDEEHPYRVKLDDGVDVWAPFDDDKLIRVLSKIIKK